MSSVEYDLRYFQAGIDQLEGYLLADQIYWPVGVSAPPKQPPYPQLTLGTLLLFQQRLRATAAAPDHQASFLRLQTQLDALRSRWRSAWSKKAAAEFRARLNLWRDFLEEYRKDPSAHFDRYSYEVGRRVTLQLLQDEADQLPAQQLELLEKLDTILRGLFHPGQFAWEAALAPSFPPQAYWYLYGHLPEA